MSGTFNRLLGDRRSSVEPAKNSVAPLDQPKRARPSSREQAQNRTDEGPIVRFCACSRAIHRAPGSVHTRIGHRSSFFCRDRCRSRTTHTQRWPGHHRPADDRDDPPAARRPGRQGRFGAGVARGLCAHPAGPLTKAGRIGPGHGSGHCGVDGHRRGAVRLRHREHDRSSHPRAGCADALDQRSRRPPTDEAHRCSGWRADARRPRPGRRWRWRANCAGPERWPPSTQPCGRDGAPPATSSKPLASSVADAALPRCAGCCRSQMHVRSRRWRVKPGL